MGNVRRMEGHWLMLETLGFVWAQGPQGEGRVTGAEGWSGHAQDPILAMMAYQPNPVQRRNYI